MSRRPFDADRAARRLDVMALVARFLAASSTATALPVLELHEQLVNFRRDVFQGAPGDTFEWVLNATGLTGERSLLARIPRKQMDKLLEPHHQQALLDAAGWLERAALETRAAYPTTTHPRIQLRADALEAAARVGQRVTELERAHASGLPGDVAWLVEQLRAESAELVVLAQMLPTSLS